MITRYGQKKDLPEIKNFLRKMWIWHDDKTNMLDRSILKKTDMEDYFKDCFNGSDKSYLLVAEESGKMIGF